MLEKLAIYCETFINLIPLSFVLGFYVSIVVGRWWQQYLAIPWPDKPCMLISAYVDGCDERGRIIRRTLARYLNLMSALTFQAISPTVKKRFPTIDHLVEAGLMTKEERRVYDELSLTHGKWWVPAQWFSSLAVRARKEGRIKDDYYLKDILNEMHVFRGNCGLLFSYDWISIPLVYTQVVTLAAYTYFLATIMAHQYLDPSKEYAGHEIDLYIPVFTLLQFFFYMGWLKVAEQLINPFGEDDDDFELNWCLDRNLQLSFNVVDSMHMRHPRLIKDMFWDETEPQLPYTKSSVNMRTQPHLGSAMNLDVNLEEAEFIPMETIMEGDKDENNYTSPPRSPAFDASGNPFTPNSETPTRRTSTASMDIDAASLSKSRFSDFPGYKFINMLFGSNRELSYSIDSVRDGQTSHTSIPFIPKSPMLSRKPSNCSELSYAMGTDEKQCFEEQLLSTSFKDQASLEERESLIHTEQPIVFQDKPVEYHTIKIPDLSVVEEESSGSSRGSSPTNEIGQVALQMDRNINETLVPLKQNISQESSTSVFDSNQNTGNGSSNPLTHCV